jgi:hypothetical protein
VLEDELVNVLEAEFEDGVEKALEELAEEDVQRLVLGSESDEVRPTTRQEVSDLRTEGHVIFDDLVAGT